MRAPSPERQASRRQNSRIACDLLIVGAGPAGMSAAIVAAEGGLDVLVVDESAAPGGQVYRNILGQTAGVNAILGQDYQSGRDLAARFGECGAVHSGRTSVFMLEKQPDGTVLASLSDAADGSARLCSAKTVIIATGALERPFPIPGWTLPGVMTAGAAQTLLKTSGLAPKGPLVLAGSGPLLMLLAAQYLRAGVSIDLILETTPLANLAPSIPRLPGFLFSSYVLKGIGLLAEVLSKVTVRWGIEHLAARGTDRLDAVTFGHRGRDHRIEATTLLLHQGVVPQVNLAMSAGAAHVWNAQRLAFEPVLSIDFESSVPGIFIVGDSGGIGGAAAAEASGTLAAMAVVRRLGLTYPGQRAVEACARRDLGRARRGRAFLDQFYRPADAYRRPHDDVINCRCEEVKAGEIRALARRGAQGPNQAKTFSRAGMGPCQGRMCGLTVCEVMAEAQQRSPADVGHMRIRPPVKPVTVAQMAQLSE